MKTFVVLGLLSVLTACATVEDTAVISYAAAPATQIPSARPVALGVNDSRTSDRNRISTKINGYGAEMAAIRSSREVPDVVREAIAAELQARGFPLDGAGTPVTVTIDRFYNQFHVGAFNGTAAGEVRLSVAVADRGGAKLFSGSFVGTSETPIMLANGSNAADSVAKALRDACNKMFADPSFVGAITGR